MLNLLNSTLHVRKHNISLFINSSSIDQLPCSLSSYCSYLYCVMLCRYYGIPYFSLFLYCQPKKCNSTDDDRCWDHKSSTIIMLWLSSWWSLYSCLLKDFPSMALEAMHHMQSSAHHQFFSKCHSKFPIHSGKHMQHVLYNFPHIPLLRLLLLIGVLQTSCDIHDVFQVGIQDFCWSLSSTMSESTSLVVNSEAVNVWACQESWWFLLLGCKFRRNSGRILAEFWITWNSDYFDRNVITAPPRLLRKKYSITCYNTFRVWCMTSQN